MPSLPLALIRCIILFAGFGPAAADALAWPASAAGELSGEERSSEQSLVGLPQPGETLSDKLEENETRVWKIHIKKGGAVSIDLQITQGALELTLVDPSGADLFSSSCCWGGESTASFGLYTFWPA